MHLTTATGLLAGLTLLHTSIAGYTLTDDYSKDTFFGNFTAFTGEDPTHGFVNYLNYDTGASSKLMQTVINAGDASYLGVDPAALSNNGRKSMRIASKKTFNKGLFIVDLLHMPASACGSWPAFWLLGSGTWPTNGEIDILEGVNSASHNQMTLHTSDGCSIAKGDFYGKIESADCGPSQENTGCAITSQGANSFGTDFNKADGGVYATEWTSQGISIWFFPRAGIPTDIRSASPNPAMWGKPEAKFSGQCNIDQYFKDMNIVFNTAFCGDWAGKVWASSGCAKSTGVATCEQYVGQKPEVFKDSFWLVNYVKVFQQQQQEGGQKGMRFMKRG